ncbi:ImuA family protein [Pseudoruegeria sp. SK021]|uniref:ImuA family protein n=1 Tax=Pseudoruegeria sp. SK021 TaxID=1933035 RepID=UPI000A25E924|nr:hypothetical protein [Pseudoruegeria sp. SK021]OSP54314.1 hypothetical protein BV911_13150 [Pseudoruegeria sp. SK021]
MDQIRLHRSAYNPQSQVRVTPDMALQLGRTHEICGPARWTLGMMIAARLTGPVIWIRPSWQSEILHFDGVQPWIDPGRLIDVTPRRAEDLLWAAEESLRSGAATLVVVELPEPPPLTPVRRLHLAAQTGTWHAATAPLGLLLTPGNGGAAGVDSRWSLSATHRPDTTEWRLECRRARSAPPGMWSLTPEILQVLHPIPAPQ